MIDKDKRVRGAVLEVLTSTLLAVLISSTALARQGQAPLQITAPTSGAIVSPGQTLSVTVGSPAGLTFAQVDVIGEFPIGLTTSATSLPAQFSVTIPSNIACGPRMLTAEGTTTSGQNVESVSIMIDVERSDFPQSLTASTSALTLESQGQQASFVLLATYADGTILRATESSYVTFASSNGAVATVDATGIVTAVASGDAFINVAYTRGSVTLQIPIPVSVQFPMLTASPSSLTFPSQGVGTVSSSQQVTLNNASGGTMNVLSVAATSDFSETDNCIASSPLGANGSCAVNVTFSPTATGSRTGNLNIANSANIGLMSIALIGTGTAAPPTPNITSLSPTSGSVGTSVTISGANFGSTQGASTVTFNGTTATPTSWSATSIVVAVPTGATTGNVLVTVGGVASNGVNFAVNSFVYVQGNSVSQTSATTITASFASLETASDLNVVVIACYDSVACQITAVTDTNLNTYAVAVGPTTFTSGTTTLLQAIYYSNVTNNGKGNAVTVTFKKAPGNAELRIADYSGLGSVDVSAAYAASIPFTPTNNGPMLTKPAFSGFATTAYAHDLLVAADTTNVVTTGAGPGFTTRIITPSNSNLLEDEEVTTTGTYSATAPLQPPPGTTSGSALYVMQMVAFRAAAH